MIIDVRNLLLGGLLLLLTGGSWWLAQRSEREVPFQPEPHSPDYYLENFTAITTGTDGRPQKQLTAERMMHYPDDDSTELTQPRMTLYDAERRPPWRIRSEQGWVSGDRQLLLLQGQVNIDRDAAPPEVRPLHLVTRDLRVQPENNYAETDQDVYASSDRSWVKARGMQVWFSPPVRIKLLAKVRGHYEIN